MKNENKFVVRIKDLHISPNQKVWIKSRTCNIKYKTTLCKQLYGYYAKLLCSYEEIAEFAVVEVQASNDNLIIWVDEMSI